MQFTKSKIGEKPSMHAIDVGRNEKSVTIWPGSEAIDYQPCLYNQELA